MPTIYPNLVPSIQPGYLFDSFVNDQSLSIRWITKNDPVMFEVANRPIADSAVRQLILAKSVDQINLRLSHQAYFPFVSQPNLLSGSGSVTLPLSWIWDMNVTVPEKWSNMRLAKIKRVSGTNLDGTDESYTGVLRLFFTASATLETYLFYVDYNIESELSFQSTDINIVTINEDSTNPISDAEKNTIAGKVIFRTLDVNEAETRTFLDAIVPPVDTSMTGSFYTNPSSYEIASGDAGYISSNSISHGDGLLTDSAWNKLPDLSASVDSWIEAFNYPFRISSSRESNTIVNSEPITIPDGLFSEFNITAPAGDNNTSDYNSYPVWVTRITNTTGSSATFYFATYNILD